MNSLYIYISFTLFISNIAMAIEEPKYQVIVSESPFELREYVPTLIAEVFVEGSRDEASNKGFRLIADFIFGNNEGVQLKESEKIAMTAPVTIEPQKIAMTAPVTVKKNANEQGWRIQFTMPSKYTLATLPKPKNDVVKIREVPGKSYAVVAYSGLNGEEKVERKTEELLQWVTTQKMRPINSPQLARYNPPWTLPPWRRNEVMVEVDRPVAEK